MGGRRGAGRAGGAGLAGAAPALLLLLCLPSADTLCSASLSLALFLSFLSPAQIGEWRRHVEAAGRRAALGAAVPQAWRA